MTNQSEDDDGRAVLRAGRVEDLLLCNASYRSDPAPKEAEENRTQGIGGAITNVMLSDYSQLVPIMYCEQESLIHTTKPPQIQATAT
jgi:hypothetical protein